MDKKRNFHHLSDVDGMMQYRVNNLGYNTVTGTTYIVDNISVNAGDTISDRIETQLLLPISVL
jgi:hypothetical protein